MSISLKPIKDQVLVITGATSGIGLATAQLAAKKGAKLVLVSRSQEELDKLVEALKKDAVEAIGVSADVAKREDLEKVEFEAINRFGTFDTWINNAGLGIFGRLEEVSEADSRQLFDINFWGVVSGSLIALKTLKEKGGALINLGSVLSDTVVPLQGMYTASKHAIKGFTDALRIELEMEKAPVSVTLIKPSAINTPYPQHARNYMQVEPKLPPPVYEASEVAVAILHAAQHPQRDVIIGGGGKLMSSLGMHVPSLMDVAGAAMSGSQQTTERPRNPQGGLYASSSSGQVRGEASFTRKLSFYTRAIQHPVIAGAIVAAVGVGLGALVAETLDRE